MSVISLTRHHQLSFDELTQRVNSFVVKLEHKLGVCSEWENDRYLTFNRKGASGSIELGDDSVEVNVRLGLMFRALKSTVEQELERVLEKQLA